MIEPKKTIQEKKAILTVSELVVLLNDLVKIGESRFDSGAWPKLAGAYDKEISGELLNKNFLQAVADAEDKVEAWKEWHEDYFAHRSPQSKLVITGGVFTLPLLLQLNMSHCLFQEATFTGKLDRKSAV